MRILVTDDHQLIRQGIRHLLTDLPAGSTIGEAADADEVLAAMASQEWDIVILDISLPGRSGLDVLKELKLRYPTTPVLMLSMHPEEEFAVRAIRAGAAGYVNKGNAVNELIEAINRVREGGKYINATVAEKLAEAIDDGPNKAPHERLSDREYEVFKLIASGKTVGEIGDMLDRSVKTISTHRTHILKKMSLQNNAEIMQYALERKLVQ